MNVSLRRRLSELGFALVFSGLLAMPVAFGQSSAGATSVKAGDLLVETPWTRATPGGAKIAGGYLKITNNGATAEHFLGATTAIADHAEIHEMSMNGGVMTMRPLADGIEIKPGESVELKPGSFHLMFMDLKQPLRQGDTLKVTLQFEKAGKLDVDFNINSIGATTGEASSHH